MEKLYSFEDAAFITGIKVPTWRAWVRERKISVVRLGRRIKIRESDLQQLIDSSVIPAAEEHRSSIVRAVRKLKVV